MELKARLIGTLGRHSFLQAWRTQLQPYLSWVSNGTPTAWSNCFICISNWLLMHPWPHLPLAHHLWSDWTETVQGHVPIYSTVALLVSVKSHVSYPGISIWPSCSTTTSCSFCFISYNFLVWGDFNKCVDKLENAEFMLMQKYCWKSMFHFSSHTSCVTFWRLFIFVPYPLITTKSLPPQQEDSWQKA